MRLAALYDVHGNLPALEAVLAEVEREGVDTIVFGGDIAAGPFPRQTVDLVRSLDAVSIRGNTDWRRGGEWGAHDWVWDHGPEASDWLTALPTTRCSASSSSVTPRLARTSRSSRLQPQMTSWQGSLTVWSRSSSSRATRTCNKDRLVDRWRFVNPGSVGRPYEDAPGAYWAIVGDVVELRRTDYDLAAAAAATRASGHPLADGLAEENVLRVPSREDGIAAFGKMTAWVQVGRVGRRHGRDGSFVVETASEDPRRFELDARLWVDGVEARVIASSAGGRPVIALDREVPRGAVLEVPVAALPPPEEDTYYAFQLVGLSVEEEEAGLSAA